MYTLSFSTKERKQVLDITGEVEAKLPKGESGVVNVFTPHTGAALTVANLDPGTDLDLLDFLQGIVPHMQWRHSHDPAHAPDHLLASLIGSSVSVPYESGHLLTGTWQFIVLIELDGPKERTVLLSV